MRIGCEFYTEPRASARSAKVRYLLINEQVLLVLLRWVAGQALVTPRQGKVLPVFFGCRVKYPHSQITKSIPMPPFFEYPLCFTGPESPTVDNPRRFGRVQV